MSIAVYANGSPDPTDDPASVRIFLRGLGSCVLQDGLPPTVVFFGGLKGSRVDGGRGVSRWASVNRNGQEVQEESSSWKALTKLKSEFPTFRVLDYDPACLPAEEDSRPVTEALSDLPAGLNPLAPLVVYGYSSGAYCALSLCLKLKERIGWFNCRTNRLEPLSVPTPDERRSGAALRVDLLITVDPCIRNYDRDHPPRRPLPGRDIGIRGPIFESLAFTPLPDAPPVVKRHVNFFQAHPVGEYFGRPATGRAENRPVPGSSHEAIPRSDMVTAGVNEAIHGVPQL